MNAKTTIKTRINRTIVVLACIFGLSSVPAAGAQLSLTSSKLTTSRTCTLSPTGTSSTAGVDTRVQQGSPTSNFAGNSTNQVQSALLDNRRLYIQFDLTKCSPAIPSTATISSALLRLFTTAVPGLVCRTNDIFRVTSSWTETAITWNNQPFGTALNNPAQASRTSSINIGGAAGCQNATSIQYVTGWTVTNDVQAFISGTTNNGWMIRDDAEGAVTTSTATYSAKDAGNSNRSPELIVDYR